MGSGIALLDSILIKGTVIIFDSNKLFSSTVQVNSLSVTEETEGSSDPLLDRDPNDKCIAMHLSAGQL